MINRIFTVLALIWCVCLTIWLIHQADFMTESTRYSGEVARTLKRHTERLNQQEIVLVKASRLAVLAVDGMKRLRPTGSAGSTE